MFVHKVFLGLVACAGLTCAIPTPRDVALVRRAAADVDACPGYTASNVVKTDTSITADLTLAGDACNAYSNDIKDLKLLVEHQTSERLHVKIYDAELNVYQVQEDVLPRPDNEKASSSDALLEFDLVEEPFSFTVKRKENGEVLFDTSSAQLVFETQYVRLRTSLPENPHLYGLGEHSDPFHLPTNNYRRSLLNAESPFIPTNANLYGSHPVYFDHRGDKGTHGVFLLNADPMNIWINKTESGDQFLEYDTIGGIIDLYFMAGKEPTDVSKQYADVVGHSAMFAYWTLGLHQCKYGYWDVNMVAEVVGNYSTAGIPLEVMWTDIDYMQGRQDFTLDEERFSTHKMQELVTTLHARDQRYVLILDPGIHARENYATYQRGHDLDVFLKKGGGSDDDYLGVQWAGTVAWPDWLAPNTKEWWTDEFKRAFDPETGVDLDGIWVDMNEASNFCPDETCDPNDERGNPPAPKNPPRPNTGRPIPGFPADFQPSKRSLEVRESGEMKGLPDRDLLNPEYYVVNHNGHLSSSTIWTNTSNQDGTVQYDTHNLYGHTMSQSTYDAMLSRRPGLRPMVLTRSTWAGSGRKATHWFGDNDSNWEDYRISIRQMLAFVPMHQMPMVGSDICGFNGNADEYMCARWALLGAFQPFYRNHAGDSSVPQEFYQWPTTTAAAKKAVDIRYKLLDYMYTALYYQTADGEPMINPLFFIYPEDANTFAIQEQWFLGDALLISPVTADYSDQVTFYLPKDTWYDYWTYARIDSEGKNTTATGVGWTDIPVHIRGGTIIPHRVNSANTTKALRKEDFFILVAPDAGGKADGRLYLDEGEKIEQESVSEINFSWDGSKFSATGSFAYGGADGESITVAKVLILGQDKAGSTGNFDASKGTIEVEGPWKLDGSFDFSI